MIDSQFQDQLIQLGFGKKEATIYLTLLSHGSHPISYIANKAKLNRGTAYQTLHSLLEKGLVSKSIKNKVQYFAPLDPERILQRIETQQKEITYKKFLAADLISKLDQVKAKSLSRPRIQYFTGIEGVRAAFDGCLEAKDSTILSYLSISETDKFTGTDHDYSFTERRIRLKKNLHTICSIANDRHDEPEDIYFKYHGTCRSSRREVRYTTEELSFPMSLCIYDDKVILISSKEENFALLVQSREFSEMQKKIFTHIWQRLPTALNPFYLDVFPSNEDQMNFKQVS